MPLVSRPRTLNRVTGVPFNTVALKKKKKKTFYDQACMEAWGTRSDTDPQNKLKPRTHDHRHQKHTHRERDYFRVK